MVGSVSIAARLFWYREDELGGVVGEFDCDCGFSAKSRAGLVAHQRRCKLPVAVVKESGPILEHPKFVNRFSVGVGDRCPRCSMQGRSFYRKDSETWVCMDCGTHFTPECVLSGLRDELAEIQWKRGGND